MTRKAVITQAQIERGLRAARAALPEQPWRVRITADSVVIEPADEVPQKLTVDNVPELVL